MLHFFKGQRTARHTLGEVRPLTSVGIQPKKKEAQKKPLSLVAAGKRGDPKRASIVKAQINYTTYPLLFLYPKYK